MYCLCNLCTAAFSDIELTVLGIKFDIINFFEIIFPLKLLGV